MRLNNKMALVTGGTTGIGFAAAQIFLREGARVAITGQNSARLAEAKRLLGPKVIIGQMIEQRYSNHACSNDGAATP